MVSEEVDHELVGGLLELVDHGVVEGILVLVEPVGQVVVHDAGVVGDGEVSVLVLNQKLFACQERLN